MIVRYLVGRPMWGRARSFGCVKPCGARRNNSELCVLVRLLVLVLLLKANAGHTHVISSRLRCIAVAGTVRAVPRVTDTESGLDLPLADHTVPCLVQ